MTGMQQRPLIQTTPTGASVAVLADLESLGLAVATLIVDAAHRALRERGMFTMALAGGSTSKPAYQALAGPPFTGLMPWDKTHVFWGDERCVDVSDLRSNERMARETLLDHVPVPAGHIHPMRCAALAGAAEPGAAPGAAPAAAGPSAPAASPAAGAAPGAHGEAAARRAADEYEVLLRTLFKPQPTGCGGSAPRTGAGVSGAASAALGDSLDLVLLGLGDNSHTASLFPGDAALDERDRWAVAALEDAATAAATTGTGERLWRVTLTAPFINRARLVVFVASGAAKAAAVGRVASGEGDPHELPGLLIRPEAGRLLWLLDEGAAAQLPRGGSGASGAALGVESYEDLPDCKGGPQR